VAKLRPREGLRGREVPGEVSGRRCRGRDARVIAPRMRSVTLGYSDIAGPSRRRAPLNAQSLRSGEGAFRGPSL
jgi:hypothetical protein